MGDHRRIQVMLNDARRRVDVIVDGKPLTPYIWPMTAKKPPLFPIWDYLFGSPGRQK